MPKYGTGFSAAGAGLSALAEILLKQQAASEQKRQFQVQQDRLDKQNALLVQDRAADNARQQNQLDLGAAQSLVKNADPFKPAVTAGETTLPAQEGTNLTEQAVKGLMGSNPQIADLMNSLYKVPAHILSPEEQKAQTTASGFTPNARLTQYYRPPTDAETKVRQGEVKSADQDAALAEALINYQKSQPIDSKVLSRVNPSLVDNLIKPPTTSYTEVEGEPGGQFAGKPVKALTRNGQIALLPNGKREKEEPLVPAGGLGQEIDPNNVKNSAQAVLLGLNDLDKEVALYGGSRNAAPYRSAVIQAVRAEDPLFDVTLASGQRQMALDAAAAFGPKGKHGDTINALNTVSQHIGLLAQAAEAMRNGNVPLANELTQKLDKATGGTGLTNFNTVAPRVSQELVRLWRGSISSEQDITRDLNNLSPYMAPEQFRQSLMNLGRLIEGKLNSEKAQFQSGLGRYQSETFLKKHPEFQNMKPREISSVQFGTPETLSILEQLEKPYAVTAPDGSVHRFTSQAAADIFKKSAGIK